VRHYEATSSIVASPNVVWAVLIDGAGWPSWDSGVRAVEGGIAMGETIKIRSEVAPGRTFPVRVTKFEPTACLRLSGGMPLGLFRGVRTYELSEQGNGSTEFCMREEYSGPLVGLIWRSMPDLGPSFDRFARGLKRRVESGVS
jgi:hypothetical protein